MTKNNEHDTSKNINNEEQNTVQNSEVNHEKNKKKDKKKDKHHEEFNKELENLKAQKDEFLDRYQRTLAEFDNFRKRTQREKAVMYDEGIRDCALNFLPVIDNFSRALSSFKNEDNMYKGVEMIYKQMTEVLKSLGVSEIEAVGQPFDPNLHDAVMHIEDENLEQNVIVEELMKGYRYKDKTIRHSMVKVAN